MTVEITAKNLAALVPDIRADRAAAYAAALTKALPVAEIDTTLRLAHFVAQIAVETGGFSSLVESTRYTNPARLTSLFPTNVKTIQKARALVAAGPVAIANCIYANVLGNGNEASGDGYKYRGRGFMMITGHDNYKDAAKVTGLPLLDNPDLLGGTMCAAETAARYWKNRNINNWADKDDVRTVTLYVNGRKLVGLAEREAYLAKAKIVWGVPARAPAEVATP